MEVSIGKSQSEPDRSSSHRADRVDRSSTPWRPMLPAFPLAVDAPSRPRLRSGGWPGIGRSEWVREWVIQDGYPINSQWFHAILNIFIAGAKVFDHHSDRMIYIYIDIYWYILIYIYWCMLSWHHEATTWTVISCLFPIDFPGVKKALQGIHKPG